MKSEKIKEPAVVKLFWVAIYKIMFSTIKEVMVALYEIVYELVTDRDKLLLKILMAIVGGPFLLVMYPSLAILALIVVVFFSIISFINYFACAVMYVIDALFLSIKGISLSCPACHTKYQLPTYVCKCGAEHKNLRPGKYGIFVRRCECGRKLPTTFINGRQSLPAICSNPNCKYQFDKVVTSRQICIPIIGGVSSGKTSLLNAGIDEIIKFAADPINNVDFKYCSKKDEQTHQNNLQIFKERNANKTNSYKLDAYKIYLSSKKSKVKNRVYIYDVAGEIYDERKENEREKIKVYEYTNSFLFVIDPLSIEDFFEECKEKHLENIDSYKRSDRDVNIIVSNMVNSLKAFNLTDRAIKKANVAVVITKADIPQIKDTLGEKSVNKLMQDTKTTWAKAKNTLCEEFLKKYNAINALNIIKDRFDNYQFFTASAWNSEKDCYESVGAGDPFLWLIDMESPALNFKTKWSKKKQ